MKAAILDVGRIGGDFTNHFDAEHVGLEQVFAGSADMLRQRQRCADNHTRRMTDMNKGIPVVVIEGMGQQAIGESGAADGGFCLGAPDGRLVGRAECSAIIERDLRYLCGCAG